MREYIPTFHTQLNVTNKLLDEMNTVHLDFPVDCDLHKLLIPPNGMNDNQLECAINFVNMLAWRMWSDRFTPLHKVYSVRHGRWGDFHNYVHRELPYPSNLPLGALLLGGGHDLNKRSGGPDGDGGQYARERTEQTENIEVVIVRPNIEHYMLGIILGQGGESLGSTFWGQTELSCYDDSMHGIWGM